MTLIKRFTLIVVLGIFSSVALASNASAASCSNGGFEFPTVQITNDPGVAVLPFTYTTDAESSYVNYTWYQNGGFNPYPLTPTGGSGAWQLPVVSVPSDGGLELRIAGHYPNMYGVCQVQVRNAISPPTVSVVGKKKGKQRVVASFEQRRQVSVELTITQKVKKKGRKAKLVRKSVASMAAKIRPGKVTAQLIVTAAGYEVHNQTYQLAAKKPKKRKNK